MNSSDRSLLHGRNVLVGATGSVAAIRVPKLVRLLIDEGANVRVIVTERALAFIEREWTLPTTCEVLHNDSDWTHWQRLGDPILHIELRRWADIFVIAPLSANTLAKISGGLCDNLLTSVARAWDFEQRKKFCVVAPAMNEMMWKHPVTKEQVRKIELWGITIVRPVVKQLACGDTGIGAMAEPEHIVDKVCRAINRSFASVL